MRFTITPLGSAGGRTVGQVVDDIVRYLEPRIADRNGQAPAVPGGEGPSSYYADRGTEPGRWLGLGAREAELVGAVGPADFAKVLAGRDPRTGMRLITAQGSAGRRPTLGAGTETRRATDGTPLYAVGDVAAALRISRTEAEGLVAAGERAAVRALLGTMTGNAAPPVDPPGSYIVPRIDADGTRWVTDDWIDRVEESRARGIPPEAVAAAGEADDLLTVANAARLGGLTAQYVRSLCRRFEQHRDEIEAACADGRQPRRAYVVAYRGTKGQWLIRRRDLVAFLERRVAPAVRVGYDLTLTTEKSLGVLALLGNETARSSVLDAVEAANDHGLSHLERHAATARRKGEQIGTRGWTVASFRHLTSRALDPFPHHHNVVANTVVDEHGTRRALDARGLYWSAQEASALATAEMRFRLTHALGVRWRPGRSGGWEVDGIPEHVLREFSRRRTEIEDAVAELEDAIGRRTNLDEVQSIVTATRPPKEEVDPSELVAGWWRRAEKLGFSAEDLARCTGHRSPHQTLDSDAVFASLTDPDHGLCARSSIFTRSDVIAALVDMPTPDEGGKLQPLLLPAAAVERLADEFLASERVIPFAAEGVSPSSVLVKDALFTTPEIAHVQQRILDRYQNSVSSGSAVVPEDLLDGALSSASHLTNQQRWLVRSLCSSGHGVQSAIGRAGAGKTTTMRVAAEAWAAAGYRVIGTAVKGEAARHLATGAGISTETVAWFLARADSANFPLDARTVLIVDEASTLSDRDLDTLLGLAERAGAAVRLIGDPDQHGAIAAGGMFRHLCTIAAQDTPELAFTHRLTDPAERAAVDLLRQGHIAEALGALEAAGRLHVTDDGVGLYVGMLQRWWRAHLEGDDHPMVDRRHHTRRQLNRLARQLLRVNGELGEEEIAASGDRVFAAGDRVVARMAARHLHTPGDSAAYVRNGAVGTVVAVATGGVPAGDRIRVDFDGIGVIDVPRGFFDEHDGPGGRRDVGIDHAYAVTSYAVQGATYASSTSRIDERASRAEAYVDLTRGRVANHLFLTRAADPLDGEHLPKVSPPPVPDAVARRLRESGPERAALELDPLAAKLAGADGIPQVREASAIAERKREITGERAARRACQHPPRTLVTQLPERSAVPYLAKKWDDAVAAVERYRAMWNPVEGAEPFAWALGALVHGEQAEAQRAEVAAQIANLTVASAAEDLRGHGFQELLPWAARHLAERAAAGACRLDARRTADLYARVRQYRKEQGLGDDTGEEPGTLSAALLGEPPADSTARATYHLLSEEITRSVPAEPAPQRGIA